MSGLTVRKLETLPITAFWITFFKSVLTSRLLKQSSNQSVITMQHTLHIYDDVYLTASCEKHNINKHTLPHRYHNLTLKRHIQALPGCTPDPVPWACQPKGGLHTCNCCCDVFWLDVKVMRTEWSEEMEGERRVSLQGEKKERHKTRETPARDWWGPWQRWVEGGGGGGGGAGGLVDGEEAKAKGESEQRARPGATAAAGSNWYTSQL